MHAAEGARALCLQVRVCLRPGEQHCPLCAGHGYQPIDPRDEKSQSQSNPDRCSMCGGTGRTQK